MSVVYDAGYLIAAERGDRVAWAKHAQRLLRREIPHTTGPVVAQVLRSGPQVRLRRLLSGCAVVAFDANDAAEVGALLARSGGSDVVDAHVVTVAARHGAPLLTSDVKDIERLAAHATPRVSVHLV
jgi:predicted nucleic acid-binding protein